jgi:hypothetical protein
MGFLSLVLSLPNRVFSHDMTVREVWEFPNETWIENLAIRSNGQILVTLGSSPELYQVDPFSNQEPTLVYRFPGVTGVLGIAEVETDIFALIAGNYSFANFSSTSGSYSVWKVDMRTLKSHDNRDVTFNSPAVKITDIREASFLNGMTAIREGGDFLLIADSILGVVWRLNFRTGHYEITLNNTLMKPVPGEIAIGINGVHARDGFLYFTNTFQGILARVPIHPDGTEAGPYHIVANTGSADDFTFDDIGNAYIAQDFGDALERVGLSGKVTVVVGSVNSTIVEGDTAAKFGRTPLDQSTLYVTTNGGMLGRVGGTEIVGGKVLAINFPSLLQSNVS